MTSYELLLTAAKQILPWYENNHRDLPWRSDSDPYHVWISEIMLQQTRVEAVKEYYIRFLKTLPNIAALANVSDETLLKLWQGLGYYNRAANLKKAANVIIANHSGVFPDKYDEILSLPGIGAYTAGAIGSISFQLPKPAVDGNVLRIISRLTDSDKNIDLPNVKKEISEGLEEVYTTLSLESSENASLLTQGFMELGATVCIPNGVPHCERCPWSDLCQAKAQGTTHLRPVRSPKKERRIEERAVLILFKDDHVVLNKRPEKGLLAKLWEFPNTLSETSSISDMQDAIRYSEKLGFHPVKGVMQTTYTHIFSHVEWRMTAYYIEIRPENVPAVFPAFSEIEADYALPSAFMPFYESLKKESENIK